MNGNVHEPLPGQHEAEGPALEIVAGWVIRCLCGWTNEMRPAATKLEAENQLRAHVHQIR